MAAFAEGGESRRVLVVDDEQNVADLYATWVEMETDCAVETVYDGEAAIEAVVGDTTSDDGEPVAAVDAVLLDRRMPGVSGDEVLSALRERGYGVPVAMVTAVKPEEVPLEDEYQEYLTKPVMREDVSRVVGTLLRHDPDADETEGDTDDAEHADAEGGDEDTEDADPPEPSGRVSEDVRETLDSVTDRLDEIQNAVERDDPGTEADGDDSDDVVEEGDDLVTAEDIRTQVSQVRSRESESDEGADTDADGE